MKQQHTLQPKLRFPEFEGDWKSIKLENIASKIGSGKTPLGGDKVYQTEGIPFIRSQNVNSDQLILDDTFIPLEVHKSMNTSKVIANDILLNITGASIGRSCVVPNDFIEGNVNQHVCIIRIKNEKPIFIQKIISSNIGQKLIYETQTGSGREGLNFESIKKFKINIPSLPEQQKIADYLSTIDNKINLLEEKKAQLVLYKKAMMKKLFSQEIRFKPSEAEALEGYPEWEEKRLGEVVSLKGGYAFKSDLFKENGVSIMRISNISNNNIYIDENNMVYYDDFKISNSYKVFTGELLIALSGATTGKASIYNLENFSYVNQRVGVFKSINKCYYNFIVQYIFSSSFTKELKKMLVAGAQPNISTSEIESIILNMPTSEKEQQKIAEFLSAIDESIEKVTEQITQTLSFKKAMLQQMFV